MKPIKINNFLHFTRRFYFISKLFLNLLQASLKITCKMLIAMINNNKFNNTFIVVFNQI